MTNPQRNSLGERNVEKAIVALKKGAYLLKYGRRGKPKFCPFRLSNDEKRLIWYIGKEEKQLELSDVSRIIPGQRTVSFQRCPRPEKEYQSFSLLYGGKSLDLICQSVTQSTVSGLLFNNWNNLEQICKDKVEAEIWFTALSALISKDNCQKWRSGKKVEYSSTNQLNALTQHNFGSPMSSISDNVAYENSRQNKTVTVSTKSPPQKRLGRVFSDFLLYDTADCSERDSSMHSIVSRSFRNIGDEASDRSSVNTSRISLSSAVSSSSQGSSLEDLDPLCDLFIWGEGTGDGLLGGHEQRIGESFGTALDSCLPKALESPQVFDIRSISCGSKHAVLVTKQGEVFSWGEGSSGKLGHGVEADISDPEMVDSLSGLSVETVECGDYHTCAITVSGELYSWGDGMINFGLLGHGEEISHWFPKKVNIQMLDWHVSSVSCGPWHTAAITSSGQLFTFGEGSFGALGHGDFSCSSNPREIESLKGLRVLRVSCGFWHTAAVVDISPDSACSDNLSNGKLFTWGSGDKGQLGHGDKESRLVPCRITNLDSTNFCKVACGHSITVALTTSGEVYTMGGADYGQLGSPGAHCGLPIHVQGKLKNNTIEDVACGSFHVVVLSSKSEVYSWGRGKSGQLGHGDYNDQNTPTLVEALKNKQVKGVACGNSFSAAICLHKRSSHVDHSVCSGCSRPFNFKRKRHNCYNCGLVFCNACTSKKAQRASLAPTMSKPYRVCEDCYTKLKKGSDTAFSYLPPRVSVENKQRTSAETDNMPNDLRQRGLLSRLSSFDSFRRSAVLHYRKGQKPKSASDCLSSTPSGSFHGDRSYTSSPSRSMLDGNDKISVSVPGSAKHSQAASCPFHLPSLTSSCIAFHEVASEDSNQKSDDVSKEVLLLREQVEILTRRSNFLASELERTGSQLKEANKLARDEAEKNNAAKEAIRSLVKKLKDMATSVSTGSSSCRTSDSFADNSSSSLTIASS